MKTLLNLLPEEKKNAIQKHLNYRFLLWQLFLLFLLSIFYFGILVSIFFVLDYQLKSLHSIGEGPVPTSRSDERRLAEYEKKFQETNLIVGVVGKIDRSHLYFSNIFSLLDTLLPKGVILDTIKTQEYQVSLFGVAAKRDDLLILDEKLKNAKECVLNMNIPITNLFSQTNIEFQVDFTVAPDCLRKSIL